MDRRRDAPVPLRTRGRRGRRPRRVAPRLGRQPRLHRPEPASGPRRRPRASGRAPRRPRPGARHRVGADRRCRDGREGGCWRTTGSTASQDIRIARRPCIRADRAAVDVPGGPHGGRCARPRGGTARAGPRDEPLVEGGAARRIHRLQPEREGPDDRIGVLGAPDAGRPRLRAAAMGRGGGERPAAFTVATMPQRFAEMGDPWTQIDDGQGSLDALLALAEGQRKPGMARRSWPPHYEKGEDEPPRVQRRRATARKSTVHPAARWPSRSPREDQGGGARRPGPLEGAPSRGRAAPRAGGRAGRRDARPVHDVDQDPRPAVARPEGASPEQEPLEVDYDPRVEWER